MRAKISDLKAEIAGLRAQVRDLSAAGTVAESGNMDGVRWEISRGGQEDPGRGDLVLVRLRMWPAPGATEYGMRWAAMWRGKGVDAYTSTDKSEGKPTYPDAPYRVRGHLARTTTWAEGFAECREIVTAARTEYRDLEQARADALKNA